MKPRIETDLSALLCIAFLGGMAWIGIAYAVGFVVARWWP